MLEYRKDQDAQAEFSCVQDLLCNLHGVWVSFQVFGLIQVCKLRFSGKHSQAPTKWKFRLTESKVI